MKAIATSPSSSPRAVRQANGLLLAAEGVPNEEVARQLGVSANTVRAWRKAFASRGVQGVGVVAPGRGRSSWLPEGSVDNVIELTLHGRPDSGSSTWTTRSLAAKVGISKDSVQRIWADHGVRPWQAGALNALEDPGFTMKMVDVVGVYLEPPQRTVLFCFAADPRIPPSDRPSDQLADGAVRLVAALDEAHREERNGRPSPCAPDLAAFFRRVDRLAPRLLEVHALVDNLSADNACRVREWLNGPRRANWHLHLIPNGSAWLRLVSSWLKQLVGSRSGIEVSTSLDSLSAAVTTWVDQDRGGAAPFIWLTNADISAAGQR